MVNLDVSPEHPQQLQQPGPARLVQPQLTSRPSQLHIPQPDAQHAHQQARLTPPASAVPPRFGAASPLATPTPTQGNYSQRTPQKLSLVTDLGTPYSAPKQAGPVSASAYIPPIGHGLNQNAGLAQGQGQQQGGMGRGAASNGGSNGNGIAQHILTGYGIPQTNQSRPGSTKPLTATGTTWEQKDRIMGSRDGQGQIPPVPAFPPYLQAYGGAFMDPTALAFGSALGGIGGGMGMNILPDPQGQGQGGASGLRRSNAISQNFLSNSGQPMSAGANASGGASRSGGHGWSTESKQRRCQRCR